jgi:NAD(P)-dependent dehydrogenase (short-subunit alcohol dehydrogenase family)
LELASRVARARKAVVGILTRSVAGHIGFPGSSVYVASKFAVIGLTKTAALEFAGQGIRVNSVSPGPIQTEMFDRAFGEGETEMKKTIATQTPVGRVGTPEEIASAVLWSPRSCSAPHLAGTRYRQMNKLFRRRFVRLGFPLKREHPYDSC